MDDRRVHARGDELEVVRYDRAGKWFVESAPGSKVKVRVQVPVQTAAARAREIEAAGGKVFFFVPGGMLFDKLVRKR